MEEKINDFAMEHPVGASAALSAAAVVVCLPICALLYKWLGSVAGKSAAKELVRSGVFTK